MSCTFTSIKKLWIKGTRERSSVRRALPTLRRAFDLEIGEVRELEGDVFRVEFKYHSSSL